jgi:hypothetical protein
LTSADQVMDANSAANARTHPTQPPLTSASQATDADRTRHERHEQLSAG